MAAIGIKSQSLRPELDNDHALKASAIPVSL